MLLFYTEFKYYTVGLSNYIPVLVSSTVMCHADQQHTILVTQLRCITYVQAFFSVDSTANGSAFVKSLRCARVTEVWAVAESAVDDGALVVPDV